MKVKIPPYAESSLNLAKQFCIENVHFLLQDALLNNTKEDNFSICLFYQLHYLILLSGYRKGPLYPWFNILKGTRQLKDSPEGADPGLAIDVAKCSLHKVTNCWEQ